jgi:TRAP-type uncharacterized transport system substrate-binding protein
MAGVPGDRGTIGVKNLLVASSQLDTDLVADIMRVIFENKDALVAAHPRPGTSSGPRASTMSPHLPSGSLRYFQTVTR